MATNGLNLQTSGLTFTTGDAVRSIITNEGLYGLGTTIPGAMLHVAPTGTTTSVRFEGLGSSSTETNYLVADSNGVLETRNDVVTLAGTQTLTNKTINGSQLVDGSVANAKLTNDDVTIGSTSIALGATSTTLAGLTSVTSTDFIGDLTGTADDATALATARDFSITGDITAAAISFDGTGNVALNASIDAGVVDTTELANGAVTEDKLATDAVTNSKIATGAVDTDELATDAVTTIKITDGNVTNAKLANSSITLAGDSGSSQTVSLGDTLTVAGGTGLSSVASATDTVTINLDNTAVGAGSYGSSSAVGTFTVDAQGRLTAASNVTIDGSAINNNNAFTTINVPTGNDPVANAYNDTLNFTSADGTLTISGNSSTDTIDFSVNLATVDSFVTGGTINSPSDGTLRLTLSNGQPDVDITGFSLGLAADSGSSTQYLGDTITIAGGTYTNTSESSGTVTVDLDTAATLFTVTADSGSNQAITPGNTLDIAGGTGLSSVVGATDTVTINLDDTAVSAGSYGSASETVTFTVDAQGRLTAASEQTISITSSEVSDFATASENVIFQSGNFTNTTGAGGINFSVSAGDSVSALLVNSSVTLAADSGSGSVDLGGTLTINGDTGISVSVSSGTYSVDLDDTAVTPGSYGSASETVTFTVDQQGRLTASSEQSISITASQVSDFDTEVLSSVFESANFVDSSEIDFTVTAGASVTAAIKSASIANSKLVNDDLTVTAGSGLSGGGLVALGSSVSVSHYNAGGGASDVTSNNSNGTVIQDVILDFDTFGHVTGATVGTTNLDNRYYSFRTINVPTGDDPVAEAYNDTLNFISSDSSVVISGNSTSDTIDITVAGSVDTNIYNSDGTLSAARTVTQAGNKLSFTGGDFSVDGTTFNVDDSANAVGVGTAAPAASAVLEVASTTKGFLFPRMTEAQRLAIGSPATGLMVYQTNNAEGVYIYKSFGWVQVI